MYNIAINLSLFALVNPYLLTGMREAKSERKKVTKMKAIFTTKTVSKKV
jgi:hypothetical protein